MLLIAGCIFLSTPAAFSEISYDDKLSLAQSIEESYGHFWALEKNLNENNQPLAVMHSGHPISELYTMMKPIVQEFNAELDNKLEKSLRAVYETTKNNSSKEEIQTSIENAKKILTQINDQILTESSDNSFKLDLIKKLLETSEHEYEEAVYNGEIVEIIEYQDSSAFIMRSQEIFNSIKSELPQHPSDEANEHYDELWQTINKIEDPSELQVHIDAITHEINEIQGVEDTEKDLLVYVDNIKTLLSQVKTEYAQGNTDVALSLSTKAYLDNFEYLESPLVEVGKSELKDELEEMMRVELRDMIKNNSSPDEINAKIDTILEKMETVAVSVPEFGTLVSLIMVIGLFSVVFFSIKHNSLKIPIK